jgi:hypothetical protein
MYPLNCGILPWGGGGTPATGLPDPVAPTGSVEFLDGTTVLATEPLVNGTATYTTSTLAVGLHAISVDYLLGDANYLPGNSRTLYVCVTTPGSGTSSPTGNTGGYTGSTTGNTGGCTGSTTVNGLAPGNVQNGGGTGNCAVPLVVGGASSASASGNAQAVASAFSKLGAFPKIRV